MSKDKKASKEEAHGMVNVLYTEDELVLWPNHKGRSGKLTLHREQRENSGEAVPQQTIGRKRTSSVQGPISINQIHGCGDLPKHTSA
jgi:hypothetical protein